MSHIVSHVNAFAASWADALIRASWQGGLVIALVWIVCRLWPGLPPTPRGWLWRLAYAKLLLGLLWLPPLALPLLPRPPAPPPPAPAAAPPSRTTSPPLPDVPSAASATALAPSLAPLPAPPAAMPLRPLPSRPTLPTVQTWFLVAWLLGVLVSLGRVAAAWRRAHILYYASTPLADEALRADAADLCRRLGIRRVPPLRVSDGLVSPLLLGLTRPAILLPAFVLTDSPRPELRLMLAHELAHLARRDLLWNALPLLAQRLFFFHPLVWLAGHEWSLAQEIACDAQAVETTGTTPSAYGRMLLGIATRRRASAASLFPTLAVAGSRHTLRRRLFAMQHIGTTSRPRLVLAAALTLALLAVSVLLPWHVVAQSKPPQSVSPVPAQKENSLMEKYPMDFALQNAKLDAQLAEVRKHLSPAQLRKVQPEIDTINADYAKEQQCVQLLEKSRADYIATHPNRLTYAQIAEVNQLKGHISEPDSIQYGIQQRQVIKGALQRRIAATQDADLKRGWRRQIKAINRRQSEDERHIRELAPSIARLRAKLAVIPADQRERVAILRHYDREIIVSRMHALVQKQVNVFQLHIEYVSSKQHAGKLPVRQQSQQTTNKASFAPPEAKTASFDAVVIGGPPPLRLAQSGASLSTPSAVTQKEKASQEEERAEFASRNAQLDAQLAAILKPLSPEQQKKAEASIAFLDAGNAKTQQHIQMLEQHRADYLAAHPNRLSDAQIALVQKVNWDKMDPYRINEGIRWEQSIKGKLQAHLEATHDARPRQGWQRQIAAIDQRRRVAERQIRQLGPAIAREEAEVVAIPEDQRARVAKLRSYDSEISAYKNIALMDKQMRIVILRQQIAGTLHRGRQSRGAKTRTSLTQLGQGDTEATQSNHTPMRSTPVKSRRNANPNSGTLHAPPSQSSAPPAKTNLLSNVNWRSADLARQLSDLHRGTSLNSAAQRIAILGGREDGGLQSIPATRYYFSPGIIVEIPVKNGVITGPLRIYPGGFNYD